MDYKYINQLLNKYWEGATTLEEENILRSFFSQKDVPGSLIQFRPLFVYEQEDKTFSTSNSMLNSLQWWAKMHPLRHKR